MSHLIPVRERLRGLDGLRALAVIGVLAFHDGRLSGGFLGVDLFFALSGFLITTLIIDELGRTDRLDLVGFWGRRLRRLLPAVMVLLVVVVIVLRSIAEPGEWIVARRDAPWAQFYAANWHQIASGAGYWDAFAAPSAFEHLWSLAIEEQFYLLWPLLVWGAWRWRRRTGVAILCVVGFVASTTAMITLFDGGDPTRVYMGTDTRVFSLLAGAVVALPSVRSMVSRLVSRAPRGVQWATATLLLVLLGSWFVVDGGQDWLFRGGLAAHSAIAAIIAVSIPATPTAPLTKLLSTAPLEYVGRLSYALYLWHWPVFVFCSPERVGVDGWTLTIIRMVSTSLFAMASYHLIEQTVRHRASWAHGSTGRGVFVSTMVATAVVWMAITIPATTNAVDNDAIAGAIAATTTTTAPSSVNTIAPSTSTTSVPENLRPPVQSAYYIGDSVAYDMWPAVEAALVAAGIEVESGAFGGVGLVPQVSGVTPVESLRATLERVRPDLLIIQLSVWDAQQSSDEQMAAFDELRRLVVDLDQSVLLLSFPTFAPARTESGQSDLEGLAMDFASNAPDLVRYADQTSALGAVFDVDIDDDGNPERKRDGIHMCPTGALRSAQWLIDFLAFNYEGVVPPFTSDWMFGPWSEDERYDSPPGACARL